MYFVDKIKLLRPKKHSLPCLFTFANACFGFLSIIKTVEKNYTAAAFCLLIAALMDACDGRIARALDAETDLGGELDSLADAISFCLAPCILLYAWFPGTVGYSGLCALSIYLCAGMFRLAKFNLCSSQQSNFIGLPTPVAAFFVTSLVWYHHWLTTHKMSFIFYKRVPFLLIIGIAVLMVSSIPFPSFKKAPKNKRRTTLIPLIAGVLGTLILFVLGYPLMFLASSLYITLSIVHWLYRKR